MDVGKEAHVLADALDAREDLVEADVGVVDDESEGYTTEHDVVLGEAGEGFLHRSDDLVDVACACLNFNDTHVDLK